MVLGDVAGVHRGDPPGTEQADIEHLLPRI